jgi:hypothetical protein
VTSLRIGDPDITIGINVVVGCVVPRNDFAQDFRAASIFDSQQDNGAGIGGRVDCGHGFASFSARRVRHSTHASA